MPFKFTSDPQEFLTAWRNGMDFDQNESEVSYRLRGNVGDLVQMRQTFTVECSINETRSLPFEYEAATGKLTGPVDFRAEGLMIDSTIQVAQGRGGGECTVTNITGRNNNTIYITTTNIAFLSTGLHSDIFIRIKDAPTYLRYQYGVVPDDIRSESENVWASPVDGNAQAYYLYDLIAPSVELFDMKRFGPFKSWDLSTSIQAAYLGTTDDYYHEYQIIHTFKICPYVDSERDNIINAVPPLALSKTKTLKYANKIELGYDPAVVGSVVNLGVTGDVGYYGENYNGKENIFTVEEFTVNGVLNGTLDPTTTNTITAKITNTGNAFEADQKVIAAVLRLSGETDYTNKKTVSYDEVFVSEQVEQFAGDAEVDGAIIKNFTITYNNDEDIDISLELEFDTDQRDRINPADLYAISFATGDQSKDPDVENNATSVNVIEFDFERADTDLIYDVTFAYYDSYAAFDGDRVYTMRADWNGCFCGFDLLFKLTQYDDGAYNRITKVESRLVLISDTDPTDYHVLTSKDMPISPVAPANTFSDGGFSYQIANGESNDTNKLPITEPLNINTVRSVPPYAPDFQQFEISGSIPRIPWREWIANNDIPTVFFDDSEENNNLNERTSNYSGMDGYSVYHELYVTVEYTEFVQVSSLGKIPKLKAQTTTNIVQLRSDAWEVIDFDLDGNPSVAISGEFLIYNSADALVNDFSTTEPRIIVADITQDIGTLDPDDIWAEVWIEKTNGTGEVLGQLHSDKDWSSTTNPLAATDEVTPGNTQYVEIVSNAGEVLIRCQTAPENLQSGVSYNIYGKLGKKTV